MNLSGADLQEIVRLLDDSDYDELEVETDRFRLVLRRGDAGESGWSARRETRSTPNVVNPSAAKEKAAEQSGTRAGAVEDIEPGLSAVTAPLVGTFYRAPRPGAEPFVEAGSTVSRDTVVAIIEVMKLMYSVTAGLSGEVVEICAENGELVQKGDRLMLVREPEGTTGAE